MVVAEKEGERERSSDTRRYSKRADRAAAAGEKQRAEWFGVESLVNLKRNLRSVIPAYGFTPVGVANPATGNFCAIPRERKAERTPHRGLQAFDGSARPRGSRSKREFYTAERLARKSALVYAISFRSA